MAWMILRTNRGSILRHASSSSSRKWTAPPTTTVGCGRFGGERHNDAPPPLSSFGWKKENGFREYRGRGLYSNAATVHEEDCNNLDCADADSVNDADTTGAAAPTTSNHLPRGSSDGYYVVRIYPTDPNVEFDMDRIRSVLAQDRTDTGNKDVDDRDAESGINTSDGDTNDVIIDVVNKDIERLELTPHNISVPVALMLLDPQTYPSRSKARKACRKANIMIHRGPLLRVVHNPESILADQNDEDDVDDDDQLLHENDLDENDDVVSSVVPANMEFDIEKCQRARVGDRIFPGDVLAKQIRIGDGYFPVLHHKKPPFDLPVLFEDDHFAIVNKPAGVVVYAQRKGGHGIMTVRAALPFCVQPPQLGTYSVLRRPQPVHRLDKPTSGLLLVAKTKPAMVHLSHQFRDRRVKKTYVAVVNGIPPEPVETAISAKEASQLGVDVVAAEDEELAAVETTTKSGSWQIIDHALDEKSAITIWRTLRYAQSLKANDNHLTLVELKPKTGRYHQLRRHMAWVCERPIIGDKDYDGGGDAMSFRDRGLFLCSNRVTLEHPYYNDSMDREQRESFFHKLISEDDKENLWLCEDDGKIMVTASIPIPDKFESFLGHEDDRYHKLHEASKS